MIPDILLKFRDKIGEAIKSDISVKNLIKTGRRYVIAISADGIKMSEYKALRKKKKPVFTKEEVEKRELIRNAIKDKTGVLFISGLLLQVLKEIKKHRLLKFDGKTQGVLNPLYIKTIETLGREVDDVTEGEGRIERKRGRIISVAKSA